ncbi:mitochondrial dynamin GTPase Msp1, partial [Spiromyces aspiralis]
MNPQTKKLLVDASQAAVYFGVRYLMSSMDPTKDKRDMKERSGAVIERLRIKGLKLNDYERIIMSEVILPEDINISFNQVGGLDHIIQELTES